MTGSSTAFFGYVSFGHFAHVRQRKHLFFALTYSQNSFSTKRNGTDFLLLKTENAGIRYGRIANPTEQIDEQRLERKETY